MFPGQIAPDRFLPVPEFGQPLLALVVRRDQSKQTELTALWSLELWFGASGGFVLFCFVS